MIRVELEQGSDEWLEFRRDKIGASDCPIILGVSPWKTPYQLWRQKVFGEETKKTFYMQRGNDLEQEARDDFFSITGHIVLPSIIQHKHYDWCIASLDGITDDNKIIVEIKCPGKNDHQKALDGEIPEKYYPQLQHQLAVTGLEFTYYQSYDGQNSALLTCFRDDEYIEKMIAAELEFYRCMSELIPPALSDRDITNCTDHRLLNAASEYLDLTAQSKSIEERLEQLKKELIAGCDGKNMQIGQLQVLKGVRKGAVDYSKIPELDGIDLNMYRKPVTEFYRLK